MLLIVLGLDHELNSYRPVGQYRRLPIRPGHRLACDQRLLKS